MAAVTTKKPGADIGVELTFPAVFQETYADSGEGLQYVDGGMAPAQPFREGDDLQDAYHEQKRKDAHHMVMAAVQSKGLAQARMLSSHMNYYGMPKPVLSQRVFANPSLGNLSGAIDSARRTMPDSVAPFHCTTKGIAGAGDCYDSLRGGVLRTLKGQEWAAQKLQERVKQLDAIDAAQAMDSLDTGLGVSYTEPGEEEGELPIRSQLDLAAAFGDLQNAMMAGNFASIMRYSLVDLGKLTRMLARWSITATADEFREALENLDAILESIVARAADEQELILEDPDPAEVPQLDFVRVAQLIAPRIQALRNYVKGMYDSVNLSATDRKTLSRSLLRSTGLTRLSLNRFEGPQAEVMKAVEDYLAKQRAWQGEQEELIQEAEGPAEARVAADFLVRQGQLPRARAAAAVDRFDRDQRQQFGARQGAYLGEALPEPAGAAQVNPMRRRMPDAGLRPLAEAAQPVFAAQAAPPALPPGALEQIRAARQQAEALAAQARAARGPVVQGQGRKVMRPMKKGGAKSATLTRSTLPTTRDGFVSLAAELRKKGTADIRINSGSQLKSIRANFIKRLGL